ncbi:MAG TPA: OB-fold nucleic acid binding domain-containing protein [Candidatus Nanoarchaeia archaeon]|nr:OB-fold nucleic acid binding domain-containing protein [Candidatus Nanoarchaeia archaeon]
MQEPTLLKIALISTILGLMFLFIYSQALDLKQVEQLDQAFLNEQIKINGVIEGITETEKATFLTVSGHNVEQFKIIFFPEEAVSLKTGEVVEISGKVTEYNGKKEIVADKIKVVID